MAKIQRFSLLVVGVGVSALLTGCGTVYERHVTDALSTGVGYVHTAVSKTWTTVEDWEGHTVGKIRESHFASAPRNQAPEVTMKARSLHMRVNSDGSGFSSEVLDETNRFLVSQGPISRQVLTVVPISARGRDIAPKLAQALEDAGAKDVQLGRYAVKKAGKETFPDRDTGWDVELISEAYVAKIARCKIERPNRWTIDPYDAIGTLGCANQTNIALMVSDPRDLIRGRGLDGTDGALSERNVRKYQEGDTEDLVDIDFSQED